MISIIELQKKLPMELHNVYPRSINQCGDSILAMVKEPDADYLVIVGPLAQSFNGVELAGVLKAPLNHANAMSLRAALPFTKPVPVLRSKRSFGVGDRLGIACYGHIRVFNDYDAMPILVQQSIRELNLTNRTYEDVLDCVSFAVMREGFKRGFGADGDHLKHPEEIEYALGLGFTMITLDASEHIRNDILGMSDAELMKQQAVASSYEAEYLNKHIQVEDNELVYNQKELIRCALIYGDALNFATDIYNQYIKNNPDVDFEISIDETATPTTPLQHYFVANELTKRGVKFETIAPRFCGEFQKGIDYIGDLKQFESELKVHSAIARHFGYKLSIHSGSDKFSTFALIGQYTKGNFHVKTAGTNWLEAMRCVAECNPKLYREIHKYALSMFEEAKKYYHVTTDLSKIADVDTLSDQDLPKLFTENDARQLIHITYGFILTAQNADDSYCYKDQLYKLWREHEEVYAEMLHKHIGKHLELLYSGFQK